MRFIKPFAFLVLNVPHSQLAVDTQTDPDGANSTEVNHRGET